MTDVGSDRGDRGANLIEAALVLPLLLVLLAGVADLGRAFYSYVTLTNAVREGARFASRFPYEGNEGVIADLVVARVKQEPGFANIPNDRIVVDDIDGLGDPKGSQITVRASLLYDTILGRILRIESLTIRTEATMRIFGVDALP
jgi:hypothetical protein